MLDTVTLMAPSPLPGDFFTRFFRMLERRTGISVTPRQKTILKKVVEERRASLSDADREAYLSSLMNSPVFGELWEEILAHLTVGETYFFRDASQMEALRTTILPSIIERNQDKREISILSAGCATGEEPYTLAMMLSELVPDPGQWNIRLTATDINPKMIEAAQRARFREWSFRNTEHRVRAKYFKREKDLFALSPEIVDKVAFKRVNLVEDDLPSLFPGLDLALCRNVVVYLCESARRSVVKKLWLSLGEGGWLILGASEGMAALSQDDMAIHSFPGAIAYRKQHQAERPRKGRAGKAEAARGAARFQQNVIPEQEKGDFVWPDRMEATPPQTAVPESTETQLKQAPPVPEAEALPQGEQEKQGNGVLPEEEPEIGEVRRLADSGKVTEASALLSGILNRNPEQVEAHFWSGILALARRDIPAAAEHLKKTIFLSSGMAVAHGLLADLYLKAGMRRLARRHYGWALSLVEGAEPESIVSFSGGLSARSMAELFRKSLTDMESSRP
ncbi:MAG: CheR family methyltransferase [Thermodesulfobacteriota bacterium]